MSRPEPSGWRCSVVNAKPDDVISQALFGEIMAEKKYPTGWIGLK